MIELGDLVVLEKALDNRELHPEKLFFKLGRVLGVLDNEKLEHGLLTETPLDSCRIGALIIGDLMCFPGGGCIDIGCANVIGISITFSKVVLFRKI